MKLRKLFLFVLVIGLAGYGIIALLRGPARSFTAALLGEKNQKEEVRGPSFSEDADRDGLSDGKEHIYGTDVANKDTDGDGHFDGEEVKKGYDPTTEGEATIAQNDVLMGNLTVRYFEWARTIAKAEDPQLNDEAVGQFLVAEGLTAIALPTVDQSEVTATDATGPEALQAYFDALAKVTLPATTASYVDLADTIIREKKSEVLDTVVAGLVETYATLQKIPAPQEVRDIHRQQLVFMKALRNLFVDLYIIDRDPVMLVRDIAWGNDLLERSVELEKQRLEIAKSIPPPQ